MATFPLTIGERILLQLHQYIRQQDDFVCPQGMSQGGIATSLGISRAHAAIELRRLMDAGRVVVRIAHVTGMPTRRKVYALTPRGASAAQCVRDRLAVVTRELLLPDGRAEAMDGPRALQTLRQCGVPEGRAVVLLLTAERIDVRRAALRVGASPKATKSMVELRALDAFQRAFVDPVSWQFEVVLGPPHAPPIPAAA